jgi:N-acetylmuramoyl-L-alanine amidase
MLLTRAIRRQCPLIVCRFLLFLLLGVALQTSAAATRRPAPASDAVNTRYTDLGAWGKANGFRIVRGRDSKELWLTNRASQFVFRAETPRMSLDGLDVRLTTPPRQVGSTLLISTRDVETLLDPLLNPPHRAPKNPIRTVAISPGHGGRDPGHVEGRHQEKRYTLLLAQNLQRQLQRAGLKVVLLRDTDTFVELDDRPARAAKAKADLFISLHFNGIEGPGARQVSGVETYCLTPAGASSSNDTRNSGGGSYPGNRWNSDNIVFGHEVHRAIVQGTDLPDRGLRRARFRELTLLKMPGILVEGGYMTHPTDAASIYLPEGRTKLARAITDGVLSYKRLVERKR